MEEFCLVVYTALLATRLRPGSLLVLTLMMEETYSTETSVNFQRTARP
jgi:hypothetical protein